MKKAILILLAFILVNCLIAQECLVGDCNNGYGEYEQADGMIYKCSRTNGKMKGFYRVANKTNPKKYIQIGYFDGANKYGKNFEFNEEGARILKSNIKLEDDKNDIITVQNDLCKIQFVKGNLKYVFLITKDKSFYIFELKDNKQVFEMKILTNAAMLSHFDSLQQPDNGLFLEEINNKSFIYPFKVKTTGITPTNSNDRDAISNIMNRKFDETYNGVYDIYKSVITLLDTVSSEQSFVRIANNILDNRKVIEKSFFPVFEQVKKEYTQLYKNKASNKKTSIATNQENGKFVTPDIKSSYVGGDEEMRKFLKRNLNPEVNDDVEEAIFEYLVVAIIDANGNFNIEDIELKKEIRGADYLTVEQIAKTFTNAKNEIKRVIGKMPKWNPSTKNGKPIKSKFLLPLVF